MTLGWDSFACIVSRQGTWLSLLSLSSLLLLLKIVHEVHREQKVCDEPRPSALNMTLPAFAAERERLQQVTIDSRYTAFAAVDRYLKPAPALSSKPAARRSTAQTLMKHYIVTKLYAFCCYESSQYNKAYSVTSWAYTASFILRYSSQLTAWMNEQTKKWENHQIKGKTDRRTDGHPRIDPAPHTMRTALAIMKVCLKVIWRVVAALPDLNPNPTYGIAVNPTFGGPVSSHEHVPRIH